LTENCNKLIEIYDNEYATIYQAETETNDEKKVTKFIACHRINQYPKLLQGSVNRPFLFDNLFEQYIDFDYEWGEIIIRNCTPEDEN